MTAETEKQQRTRLAAGMLSIHEKVNGEVRTTLCPPEKVQGYVRLMTPGERAELTAEVDWLCAYEAGEAFQGD